MDKEHNSLRHRQREESETRSKQSQRTVYREFASVEEVLQTDRAHSPPPEGLAERVSETLEREAARPESWWSRWFGGKRHE